MNETNADHTRIYVSAQMLEEYFKNVTISTIALNPSEYPLWQTQPITVLHSADIYSFNQKTQFYVPYAVCFFATLVIYAVGIYSIVLNKTSAKGSFLQIVATSAASEKLRSEALRCSNGGEESFQRRSKIWN